MNSVFLHYLAVGSVSLILLFRPVSLEAGLWSRNSNFGLRASQNMWLRFQNDFVHLKIWKPLHRSTNCVYWTRTQISGSGSSIRNYSGSGSTALVESSTLRTSHHPHVSMVSQIISCPGSRSWSSACQHFVDRVPPWRFSLSMQAAYDITLTCSDVHVITKTHR